MPRVLQYTPAWLTRPSPGFEVFVPKKTTNGVNKDNCSRPKRNIASRGTEIFVAVGNEIRWSDLIEVKEARQHQGPRLDTSPSHVERSPKPDGWRPYRVLKAPVHGSIQELIISPQQEFMAIVTTHTIFIAVLPSSDQFGEEDNALLRLKTWQLGRTAHVLEEPPIASVLWHPLGHRGRCIVTITADAVVRLWELNRSDRSTFDEPALAIDLKKLANATSADENLGASKFGASKGFSPDSVELEVASACFGDFPEQEGAHGWAPMTLWLAMREGDLYALCPLLPSRWQLLRTEATSTFMQTLITSIHSNYAIVQEDRGTSPEDRRVAEQQLQWLSNIADQEPMIEDLGFEDLIEVYSRPKNTPTCPQLQGPFSFTPELEEVPQLSDIIVFALKTLDDGGEDGLAEGLPISVICLVTKEDRIHVCLDLEGVQGRWLAPGKTLSLLPTEGPEHRLVFFETVHLLSSVDIEVTDFDMVVTPDVHSDYAFYVTNSRGIFYVSIASWAQKLEKELAAPASEGSDYRLNTLLEGSESLVEKVLPFPSNHGGPLTACAIFDDSDIGYFLLTTLGDGPHAATLDKPDDELVVDDPTIKEYMALDMGELTQRDPRQPYQPPGELWKSFSLKHHMENNIPARRKATLKDEVKLSPATLEVLMDAHRILSQETHELGLAVSDLFRRCERLKDEFKEQISRAAQLNRRINDITGADEVASSEDSQTGEMIIGSKRIEQRLQNVTSREEELTSQYDRIRKKLVKMGGRDLSEKESAWIAELDAMDRALDDSLQAHNREEETQTPVWSRLQELMAVHEEVKAQANAAIEGSQQDAAPNEAPKVTLESRKQSDVEIQELLDREDALVDAARERLRRLGITMPM